MVIDIVKEIRNFYDRWLDIDMLARGFVFEDFRGVFLSFRICYCVVGYRNFK